MDENLPVTNSITEDDLRASGLPSLMKMSPGLALFFNDKVYDRCKAIASHMARAEGMMPKHLVGKPEACFAVISRAITWNLDPYSVAMATYQTPGGSIGYMGTLVQSILESSGALEGGIKFEHGGDWSKVHAKFKIMESQKGGKYVVPTWTPTDAAGLYVIVSAKLKGELEARTLKFDLIEAFPLNSPLWATAPNRQICYTSVRAFGNICTPALLMGVPFDVDPAGFYDGTQMADITPARPASTKPNAFTRPAEEPKPEATGATADEVPQEVAATAEGRASQDAEVAKIKPDKNIAAEEGERPESTLARGLRLLRDGTKTTNEVADLRLTIAEELMDADDDNSLAIWEKSCTERSLFLTGKGHAAK